MSQNDNWRKRYESLVKAVEKLQLTIDSQATLLRIRNSQLEQAQNAVDIAKQTLTNSIKNHAQTEAGHIKQINLLMDKLKELGFADFDSLGN